MEIQYSSQYCCACVILDGTESPQDVIDKAYNEGATYQDGEDECFVLQFPNRPKELYTEKAVRLSLRHNG